MLGIGILAAGAILLWASLTGKAEAVLSALQVDIQHFNPSTGAIGTTQLGGSTGGSNRLVGHFVVNLPGGGSVTTNASDPAAAIENVKQQTGMTGTVA